MRNCQRLAHHIHRILQTDVILDPDVIQYMTATLSDLDSRQIQSLLDDESDGETDAFIELLFYPDVSVQMQLEPILERERFTRTDQREICQLIDEHCPETRFILPDNQGTFSCTIPGWALEKYVHRLNIHHHLPSQLTDAIHRYVEAPKEQLIMKVLLRNRQNCLDAASSHFFCWFFEHMAYWKSRALDYLQLLITMMDQANTLTQQVLIDHRDRLRIHLELADRVQQQLDHNNIETLILRGTRIPCIHRGELIQTISWIDDMLTIMTIRGTPEERSHA